VTTKLQEHRKEPFAGPLPNADDDSDYVYDEFIRRAVHEIEADPRLVQIHTGEWINAIGPEKEIPRDIGLVVITEEDAQLWDELGETDDDHKEWDSEDQDSNGGRSLLSAYSHLHCTADIFFLAFAPQRKIIQPTSIRTKNLILKMNSTTRTLLTDSTGAMHLTTKNLT
jgi:hypothetical protein